MKTVLKILGGVLVIGVLAAIVVFGSGLVSKMFEPEKQARTEGAVDVRVAKVERGRISEIRIYNGNIEPLYEVELMPQIQGRLDGLHLLRHRDNLARGGDEYEEGEALDGYVALLRDGKRVAVTENLRVREGDILAVLDYEGLRADMMKAGADYQKALRTEENTLREKSRWEELFKEGSATEIQRDDAGSAHRVAVEETRSGLAELDLKRWEYNQAFLRAPFDGVVSVVYVDPGATVGPGTPVLRLIHLDTLKVVAYVPNRYIGRGRISEGVTEVEVLPEGDGAAGEDTRRITGVVSRIYEESDRDTRTTPIEIILDREAIEESGCRLRANMYAKVRFFVRTKREVVRIPADAVIKIEDEEYVFIVTGGLAEKRPVRLGIWEGGAVEVVEGLEGGEDLVVGGGTKLADGSRVRISGEGEMVQPVFGK